MFIKLQHISFHSKVFDSVLKSKQATKFVACQWLPPAVISSPFIILLMLVIGLDVTPVQVIAVIITSPVNVSVRCTVIIAAIIIAMNSYTRPATYNKRNRWPGWWRGRI